MASKGSYVLLGENISFLLHETDRRNIGTNTTRCYNT